MFSRFCVFCAVCVFFIALVVLSFQSTTTRQLFPVHSSSSSHRSDSLQGSGSQIYVENAEWSFNTQRDSKNLGLTEGQCQKAFPGYFQEIERAVAFRKDNKLSHITPEQLDVNWREGGEILRVMIYERQLYIIDAVWASHGSDLPRAIAILHAIHRSIIAFPGDIPNIEFTFTVGDWPGDREALWPIWVLTRWKDEEDKWVMPDFGYWSWPGKFLGEYSQIRRDISEIEMPWNDKAQKAVWRGAVATNELRETLVNVSRGEAWSDIQAIEWPEHSTDGFTDQFITISEHCNYQYLVHTEGHTYSGRGKYLLNCESVSIVHKPNWIEPHTHLMKSSGPDQNIVQVERDFSDLKQAVEDLMIHDPQDALRIAQNSVRTFRDRYLTPAAEACYWRELFRAWRGVSFEPELYNSTTTPDGKVQRQYRGTPFETFVSELRLPPKDEE